MSAFPSLQRTDELTKRRSALIPASHSLVPACSGLGHTCSADASDTGNLLDREMRPPEPQQAGIAFGTWQGLEQRRIYARQDFARNGKGFLNIGRDHISPITSPVRFLGSAVAAPFNAIGNVFSNLTASQESLDDLKKQNEVLTSKVAELSEAQKTAERLEGLVGLQSTYNLKSTAARIVGASGDAWTSTVTIDKGSADGLTINMPVTSSAGVIGQIIEVSAKTSTVRLIGDENSGVSAMVQDTRAQGMLQGQPDGTLRLEYVSVDSDVKVGDIIVTSGIGGVFPKGLPLGTVSSVEKSANDVYYTIVVRAQTTAENNEEVLVITSLTDEQSASDEDVSTANSTPQGTSRDAATKTKDESSDDSSDTSETTDSGSSE